MKKFFKALALVLALTLVIGTIPASAASTAKFKMKKNTKIIYIDGSKGEKAEDGTKCKTLSKFTVTKWIEGFDADTMDLKLKTADKTIAAKSNKYDRVYAKGIGTVKVTLYIIEKDTGRQIGTIDNFKVKVKKNAAEADKVAHRVEGTYVNLEEAIATGKFNPDDYTVFEADKVPTKLGVNVVYTIRLTRKDADGNYTDTDARNLVCLDKDGNPDKDVEIVKISNTLFAVRFLSGRTFKLTALAYQSAKFDKVTAKEDFDVTVGYTLENAVQESLDSVKVTFASPVKKDTLDAKNFEVYSLTNEKKVAFTKVAGITYLEGDDANSAIVSFYRNFDEGKKYFLKYSDQEAIEFDTTVVDTDSVESIEIADVVVEAGVWTTFTFKARDAKGVDITKSSKVNQNGFAITLDPKDGAEYKKTAAKEHQVRVANADGKEYTIKVDYKWKSKTDGADRICKNPGIAKLTAVAPAAWEVKEVKAVLTKANAKPAYKADGTRDTDAVKVEDECVIEGAPAFSLSEAANKVKVQFEVIFARTNEATGKEATIAQIATRPGSTLKATAKSKNVADYTADDQVLYSSYVLVSSQKDIIMIGSDNTLIGNKEGTATILIYGVDKNDKNNKVCIGDFEVTVKAKRKATTFDVVVDGKDGLNTAFASDTVKYKYEVKDQFGAVMAGKQVTVKDYNPMNDADAPKYNRVTVATGGSIVVSAGDVTWPTTAAAKDEKNLVVNIQFECADNDLGDAKTKIVSLNVSKDSKAVEYKLHFSADTLETNFDENTKVKSNKVELEGRNADGFLANASDMTLKFTDVTPSGEVANASTKFSTASNMYYYTVFKDGVQVKGANNFNTANNTFTNITVTGASATASGSAIKLAAGTYTITAYKVVEIENGYVSADVVDTKTFTVTNNQTPLTAVKKQDLSVSSITKDNVLGAFEVKFGNAKVTNVYMLGDGKNDNDDWHVAEAGSSAYVYKIRYRATNKALNATFEVVADVNTLVEKK
jgi:hypothetical protein